jgi:hypothetical protein
MAQQQLLGAKKLVNVNFLFTVSIYLAGTFKIYIAPSGIAWCSKIFIYTKRNYLVVNL